MAKTKKTKKKNGGATASSKAGHASKKAVKKLAKKVEGMGDDIVAAHQSDRTLGERLDQGLETLANDLRKISTGIEAHVNAVKFEANKQVEAAKTESGREIAALKADMAKQIEAAKADASRLMQAVKAETSALLADAGQASDQVIAKLKDELAQARAEIDQPEIRPLVGLAGDLDDGAGAVGGDAGMVDVARGPQRGGAAVVEIREGQLTLAR